jgi:hypothetical protein
MGALATAETTHISMVVPMTGYALSTAFCYYVLFDERYHHHQDSAQLEKGGDQRVEDVGEGKGEVEQVERVDSGDRSVEDRASEETVRDDRVEKDKIEEI